MGIIALGNNNVYGLVAIATGNKKPFEKGVYMNGKAFGVIAIGREARGVFALSYGEEGEGTYQFFTETPGPRSHRTLHALVQEIQRRIRFACVK